MEFNMEDLLGSGSGISLGGSDSGASGLNFSNFSLGGGGGAVDGWVAPMLSSTGAPESSGIGDVARSIGGGIRDVTGPIGDIAKSALPLAQLGTAGVGAVAQFQAAGQLSDQAKIQKRAVDSQLQSAQQARQTAGQVSAPAGTLTNFGQTQLQRAEGGQVDPAQQAMIDQWASGAKQQMRQYLASSGMGTSQTMAQMEAHIDQLAVAMRTQALQEMKTGGVSATQAGGQLLTGASGAMTGAAQAAGNTALSADQSSQVIMNLIAQANQQLAKMSSGAS